jgi:hypothetical protein
MMRKFAVALIATTMLVAPALAADTAKSTPAAPVAAATTPAATSTPAAVIKSKTHKTLKVAHRHGVHHMLAKNHSSHVKTAAKVSKPVAPATTTAATTTLAPVAGASGIPTPAAATASKPAVKTIKAGAGSKKLKVAHRHNGHKLAAAKTFKHASLKHGGHEHGSHVKTAKVSKPVKHANAAKKTHKPATHEAKNGKVTAN